MKTENHWLRMKGEVPRGEKMLYAGTDPESYITEYTCVNEKNTTCLSRGMLSWYRGNAWTDMRRALCGRIVEEQS